MTRKQLLAPLAALALVASAASAETLSDDEMDSVVAGGILDTNFTLAGLVLDFSEENTNFGGIQLHDPATGVGSDAQWQVGDGTISSARDDGRSVAAGGDSTFATDTAVATSNHGTSTIGDSNTIGGNLQQSSGGASITTSDGLGSTANSATTTNGDATNNNMWHVEPDSQTNLTAFLLAQTNGNVGQIVNLYNGCCGQEDNPVGEPMPVGEKANISVSQFGANFSVVGTQTRLP
ncbi:MAG: hypothetical protein AAF533_24660 [Acidobacteriota bacterium]